MLAALYPQAEVLWDSASDLVCAVHDANDVVPGRICGHALPCPEHP